MSQSGVVLFFAFLIPMADLEMDMPIEERYR